jgi:hypothetical protein
VVLNELDGLGWERYDADEWPREWESEIGDDKDSVNVQNDT